MERAETFEAGDGARRLAAFLPSWPPAPVAATTALAGALVLIVLMIGLGLLLTDVLSPRPVGIGDAEVSSWLASRRTATLDTWTDVGSMLAGTGAILVVAGVAVGILMLRRLWHEAGFIVIALAVEFTVFLTTTFVVDRPRPQVDALDPLPVTSSYPSGHAAAGIALYVGLAIVITSHVRSLVARLAVWIVGILLAALVASSRIYRGMHHTTDVAASILLGTGALLVALLAVRVADAVADARRRVPAETFSVPAPSEEVPA